MIRIFIADDHAIVREGLKQIVADNEGMIVAGEASSGQELLSKVRKDNYDIVLLDISMPGQNGLDVLKELKHQWPKIPVLVLSMHPEEQYAMRSIKAGASGYLTKESAPNELINAIRKISRGGNYISSSITKMFVSELSSDIDKPFHQKLSNREYQIMCLIAAGKTTNEIAAEIMLSASTVSTYRHRLLSKLNMQNTTQLMRYAVENNLVF